jgi:hypothetical protein
VKGSVIALYVLLILVPLVRVVSTYHVFSTTNDEPFHIKAGLEWLQHGTYNTDPEHPPLARVAFALAETHSLPARAGNLIFFLIALVVVAVWSRSLLALALFGALPPVLAHAGLATTDCAAMAMTLLALYIFNLWVERSTWPRAIALGFAVGVGLLAKFSFIVFFPVAAVMFIRKRPRIVQLAPAALIAALIVWGGYRFTFGTIEGSRPSLRVDESVQAMAAQYAKAPGYAWVTPEIILRYRDYANDAGIHGFSGIDFVDWAKAAGYPSPSAGRAGRDTMQGAPPIRPVRAFEKVPLPAPLFFAGIETVQRHSGSGHTAFLLGRTSVKGWWYYFPVVFFFKTPLAFVILSIIGIVMLFPRGIAIAPVAMLLVAMTSGINIGVRHILPIYPFLAMCAACAANALWPRAKWLVIALLAWFFVATSLAHPDYLAYFNEAAGRHPENIAVDSNLDWGQDVLRLAHYVRREHIPHLYVAAFGDWTSYDMPAEPLPPNTRVAGWIAISENKLKLTDAFAWLDRERPVKRIGKSIRLYYIPK